MGQRLKKINSITIEQQQVWSNREIFLLSLKPSFQPSCIPQKQNANRFIFSSLPWHRRTFVAVLIQTISFSQRLFFVQQRLLLYDDDDTRGAAGAGTPPRPPHNLFRFRFRVISVKKRVIKKKLWKFLLLVSFPSCTTARIGKTWARNFESGQYCYKLLSFHQQTGRLCWEANLLWWQPVF